MEAEGFSSAFLFIHKLKETEYKMSIIDLMKDSSSDTSMNGQVAIKIEINKIKRRVNNYIDDILDFINSETNYINKNLSYGSPNVILTDEQKKTLIKEIENSVKELPAKLDKELKDIYGNSSVEDRKEEPAKVEIVKTEVPAPVEATPNYFGY